MRTRLDSTAFPRIHFLFFLLLRRVKAHAGETLFTYRTNDCETGAHLITNRLLPMHNRSLIPIYPNDDLGETQIDAEIYVRGGTTATPFSLASHR